MTFIKALCPLVAFECPEVKGLRAFDFRSFYECGAKSLIGPIGVDIQLFNPIPVQDQHTGNCFVDFSHPYLCNRHDGSHKVRPYLLVEMHKRGNRRHRRMARAQENFCGRPVVAIFGPPNPGRTVNSHSRRSTTRAEHARPVVSEGDLNAPSQRHHGPRSVESSFAQPVLPDRDVTLWLPTRRSHRRLPDRNPSATGCLCLLSKM